MDNKLSKVTSDMYELCVTLGRADIICKFDTCIHEYKKHISNKDIKIANLTSEVDELVGVILMLRQTLNDCAEHGGTYSAKSALCSYHGIYSDKIKKLEADRTLRNWPIMEPHINYQRVKIKECLENGHKSVCDISVETGFSEKNIREILSPERKTIRALLAWMKASINNF